MHDLEIAWHDGNARFSPKDSPVAVGRSPEAAVILTDPAVSRRHLEFVWLGSSWIANDSSTHGSFDPIGVRLAPTWTVGADTTLRLGGLEGTEVILRLVAPRPESEVVPRPGPVAEADAAAVNTPHVGPAAEPPDPPPTPGAQPPPIEQPAQPQAPGPNASPEPQPAQVQPPQVMPGSPPLPIEPPAEVQAPLVTPGSPPLPIEPPAEPAIASASPDAPPQPVEFAPGVEPPPVMPGAPPTPVQPHAEPAIASMAPGPASPPIPVEMPAQFDAPPASPSLFADADPFLPPDSNPSILEPSHPNGNGVSAFEQPVVSNDIGSAPSLFENAAPPPPPPPPSFENGATAFEAPIDTNGNGSGHDLDLAPSPSARNDSPAMPPPPPSPIPEPDYYDTPAEQVGALPPAGVDKEPADPHFEPGPGWDPVPATAGAHTTASETIIGDSALQLSIDGKDFVFFPGTEVTIGRDPNSLVRLDERHALVSRRHLSINHYDDGWWIEDFSSKGTFIDGRKLTGPYPVEGAFLVHLGDDEVGTSMRVITAGEHRAPRSQNLLLLAIIALLALLVVVALAVFLQSRDSGQDQLIGVEGSSVAVADLALAKQATVLLLSQEGTGSGFFVTENLIVTNQHVAVLAPSLSVAVSRNSDEPAEIEYRAETVALHPFLDIAVLKLSVDRNDNPVDGSGLQPVALGDSGALTLGDQVYNTGFPEDLSLISSNDMGDLLLPPVSATSGEAASFSIWPGCSNPNRSDFIPVGSPPGVQCAPDGDVGRGIIITTFSSGQGASGSPVFRGSEVIGVVFAGPDDNENAGRNISASAFTDWLDGVIAENR